MRNILALGLVACLASPVASQTTTLSSQQVRTLSANLLAEGNPAQSASFSDLILAVNPNDIEGLILRSRAAIDLGDFKTAGTLSQRAFRVSSDPNVRYITARIAAVSHAQRQQDTRAQLWLRLARQYSPNEDASQQVARDYQAITARNPWSNNFQFGITPSSNVNGGSTQDSVFVAAFEEQFGAGDSVLSIDGRDLPGLEIFGGFRSNYRLSASNTSATFLDFSGQFRAVKILQSAVEDENAKEQARVAANAAQAAETAAELRTLLDTLPTGDPRIAPLTRDIAIQDSIAGREFVPQDVSGSDFSSYSLGTGITHRRILADGWEPTTFRLQGNYIWYAGDPLAWTVSGRVSQGYRVSEQLGLSFSLGAEHRSNFERGTSAAFDSNRTDARTTATYKLNNADQVSVSFDLADSRSSNDNRDYDRQGIYVDYAFGRDFNGFVFGIGAGFAQQDYGFDQISGEDRKDDIFTFNARVRLTEVEYFGFQPEISMNASRTNSVNQRFDTDTFRIGFDLRSSF